MILQTLKSPRVYLLILVALIGLQHNAIYACTSSKSAPPSEDVPLLKRPEIAMKPLVKYSLTGYGNHRGRNLMRRHAEHEQLEPQSRGSISRVARNNCNFIQSLEHLRYGTIEDIIGKHFEIEVRLGGKFEIKLNPMIKTIPLALTKDDTTLQDRSPHPAFDFCRNANGEIPYGVVVQTQTTNSNMEQNTISLNGVNELMLNEKVLGIFERNFPELLEPETIKPFENSTFTLVTIEAIVATATVKNTPQPSDALLSDFLALPTTPNLMHNDREYAKYPKFFWKYGVDLVLEGRLGGRIIMAIVHNGSFNGATLLGNLSHNTNMQIYQLHQALKNSVGGYQGGEISIPGSLPGTATLREWAAGLSRNPRDLQLVPMTTYPIQWFLSDHLHLRAEQFGNFVQARENFIRQQKVERLEKLASWMDHEAKPDRTLWSWMHNVTEDETELMFPEEDFVTRVSQILHDPGTNEIECKFDGKLKGRPGYAIKSVYEFAPGVCVGLESASEIAYCDHGEEDFHGEKCIQGFHASECSSIPATFSGVRFKKFFQHMKNFRAFALC